MAVAAAPEVTAELADALLVATSALLLGVLTRGLLRFTHVPYTVILLARLFETAPLPIDSA